MQVTLKTLKGNLYFIIFHFIIFHFPLWGLLCLQYNRSSTYGEEGIVFNNPSFTVAKNLIVNKRACIAWTIAKNILQITTLVTTHIDDAMVHINGRIVGLNRRVAF